MQQQFHDDGTPKSTNNAFTLKRTIDRAFLKEVRRSSNGVRNGRANADKRSGATSLALPEQGQFVLADITMEAIEARSYRDSTTQCLEWLGSMRDKSPVIHRGSRPKVRVRKWIAENVLGFVVPTFSPVRTTCGNKSCVNPAHIDTTKMGRKQ